MDANTYAKSPNNDNIKNIKIRQFQYDDLSSVKKLFSDGYLTYDKSVLETRCEYIKDVLNNHLQDINKFYIEKVDGNFWVAEYSPSKNTVTNGLPSENNVTHNETRVIGCIGINPISIDDNDFLSCVYKQILTDKGNTLKEGVKSTTFELQHLFVDPSFHGVGLAQRLVKTVENFVFCQRGGMQIILNTGADMKRACRFYEKVGYECLEVQEVNIKDIFPNGLDTSVCLHYFVKYRT